MFRLKIVWGEMGTAYLGMFHTWAQANAKRIFIRHALLVCVQEKIDGEWICQCTNKRNAVIRAEPDTSIVVGRMLQLLALGARN